MKHDLKYATLWQNKRAELPVDGSPAADWLDMQSLLDQQLPNPSQTGNSSGNPTNGSGGAAGMGSGIIKLIAVLAITIPAAVALYFVVRSSNPKKQPISKQDSIAAIALKKDSLSKDSISVKQEANNMELIAYNDSIVQVQQQISVANIALNSLLSTGTKTPDVKDSIAVLKRTLAASNRVLSQLVAVRNEIANNNKTANGNGASGNRVASSPGTTVNADKTSGKKDNTPGDGSNADNTGPASTDGSTTANKKANKSAINTLNANKRHAIANNGSSRTGANVNQPVSNNRHGGRNKPGGNPGLNSNGKLGNNGNTLSGSNGRNAGNQGSNSPAGIPGSDINTQDNINDILMAANGYHPDADVFGSIITSGSYPFINGLRPGDMRYKLRVYPGIGNSKIDVNKPDKPKKDKKIKAPKNPGDTTSNLDWGLLIGANTNGSFTSKNQNANIYGSLPIDMYIGLFGTYHFNNNWGLNAQLWLYNPQNISGGYSHANGSKVDSGKVIQVTDSRKAYFVTIPVHAMYQITDNLGVKFGPVISLPVRQINGSTSLTPTTISRDSTYYKKTITQINATKYQQQLNFGLSGGLQFNSGRLSIEATYLKNLGGYKVSSDYGTYTASPGVVQFTVGFRLNRGR